MRSVVFDPVVNSSRRAPDDLSLSCVELQSIGPHPHHHVVSARGHLLLQLYSACQMSDAVDLHVVGVQVSTVNIGCSTQQAAIGP